MNEFNNCHDPYTDVNMENAGKLFIQKLIENNENMSYRIAELENLLNIRVAQQQENNKLFGETLLLSVLLLRHAHEGNDELLNETKQRLSSLIRQAAEFNTFYAISSELLHGLLTVCGKSVDTRELKHLLKPHKSSKS